MLGCRAESWSGVLCCAGSGFGDVVSAGSSLCLFL